MLDTKLDPDVEAHVWNETQRLKLTQRMREVFTEVHRRRMTDDEISGQPAIADAWVGCDLPAVYEKFVAQGLFKPVSSKPNPRAKGWYKLTEDGIAMYRTLFGPHALTEARVTA